MTDEKLAEIEARVKQLSPSEIFKDGWEPGKLTEIAAQVAFKDAPALLDEVKALRHDIARHVQITSDQAEEIDRLRNPVYIYDASGPGWPWDSGN